MTVIRSLQSVAQRDKRPEKSKSASLLCSWYENLELYVLSQPVDHSRYKKAPAFQIVLSHLV